MTYAPLLFMTTEHALPPVNETVKMLTIF